MAQATIPIPLPAADSTAGTELQPVTRSVGSDWRSRLQRIAFWLVVADVMMAALIGGIRLRRALWETTRTARFTWDVENGYHWGSRVFESAAALAAANGNFSRGADWKYFLPAYKHLYDQVVAESPNDKYQLDYSPGRLMVMALWVRHERTIYPHTHSWVPQYSYTAPLLRFNTACELLAALAACLLVRHWMLREESLKSEGRRVEGGGRNAQGKRPPTSIPDHQFITLHAPFSNAIPMLCGLLAALLIWFNPAVLIDAHVWPQWDVWLLPFFLMAILTASLDRWFTAGAILSFGAMFKGQLVMVAPLLLLWPLFAGQWGALLRVVAGAGFSLAVISCCWMANGRSAWIWIAFVMLSCAWFAAAHFHDGGRKWRLPAIAAIAAIGWPWLLHRPKPILPNLIGAVALLVLVKIGPLFGRRRATVYWAAGVFAAAVFVAFGLFDGSLAWQKIGYGYPTYHFPWMVVGEAANLAAILAAFPFLWQLNDTALHLHLTTLGIDCAIPIRIVLITLYCAALVLCGVGAAHLSRRNDRRFLLVPGATCLLMFALLPQMHERYLLWGAAATALAAGVSTGLTLLHLLLTAVAFEMICPYMLDRDPNLWPSLHRFIASVFPGDAWAILLCAAIFLYQIFKTLRSQGSTSSE